MQRFPVSASFLRVNPSRSSCFKFGSSRLNRSVRPCSRSSLRIFTSNDVVHSRSDLSTMLSQPHRETATVPVLPCTDALGKIHFLPSPAPHHPLHSPQLQTDLIPRSTLDNLLAASSHLHAQRLVAIPTETVYGLGASTLSPLACRRVYALKGRPSDNPLIVHISSLEMLTRLTPSDYTISELYTTLVSHFWPGPLTLLFPHHDPPPQPAPQTIAIRFPTHPIARALISLSDLPISAPSANSSGRPSPTRADHVFRDLGEKGTIPDSFPGSEGQGVLGCILDAGDCEVGVESTVVDGLAWGPVEGGCLKVLRPGGVGVEVLEEVVVKLDERLGLRPGSTKVWVYGRDAPLSSPSSSSPSSSSSSASSSPKTPSSGNPSTPPPPPPSTQTRSLGGKTTEIQNPSTPGMKYKHYSPSIPVYLLYPSSHFTVTTASNTAVAGTIDDNNATTAAPHGEERSDKMRNDRTVLFINKQPSRPTHLERPSHPSPNDGNIPTASEGEELDVILRRIGRNLQPKDGRKVRLGLMGFEDSGLWLRSLSMDDQTGSGEGEVGLRRLSLGRTVEDAARRLFSGMLELENRSSALSPVGEDEQGVDAILIEATNTYGIGLAFMERAGKAVGGGGGGEGLGLGLGNSVDSKGEVKRFLVNVD